MWVRYDSAVTPLFCMQRLYIQQMNSTLTVNRQNGQKQIGQIHLFNLLLPILPIDFILVDNIGQRIPTRSAWKNSRASQWEADARSVLHHPTYDYQHSRCRSLEALRLQQLGKPPQCFSCSWLSHQWMNITSPQRDLEVSVSNETHFSSQRDKALKYECHLQSKGDTRNRAICRYSFMRYERYSLTATIK